MFLLTLIPYLEVQPIISGNPYEISILELAGKVVGLVGSKSKLGFKPLPADDPNQYKPDIKLAREMLGWEPKVKLEEGLERAISYFKTILENIKEY